MSWPVSDAFLAAMGAPGGHTVVLRVDILDGGRVIRSTGEVTLGQVDVGAGPLAVATGNVHVEARGDARRSGSLTIPDAGGTGFVPIASGALLDPLAGREWRPWRGLVLPDGSTELVPLGTFTIEEATVEETNEAITVALSGRDRMAAVAENTWRRPYNITGAPLVTTAIAAIVNDRLPHLAPVPTNLCATTYTLPNMTLGAKGDGNAAADSKRLAAGAALDVFFDPLGRLTVAPMANPLTVTVVRRHLLDGTGLRGWPLRRRSNRASLRNGVIVRGSSPWLLFPVAGEAWDTDRASSTYSGMVLSGSVYIPDVTAPTWARPRPERLDEVVFTDAQAAVVAAAKLQDFLGIEELVDFTTVVDASLEVGDVVEVEAESFGGRALLPLDAFDVPIDLTGADVQTLSARRRRR